MITNRIYKSVWIIALLALLLSPYPANSQAGMVANREQIQLDAGRYVDSFRVSGGMLVIRAAPNWDSLHLISINQGLVTDLDSALPTVQARPESIAVNACGENIYLFVGWQSGELQMIHWQLTAPLDECKKATVYLPVAGGE